MNGVSWHESRDWAARAGGELRLPSEAEWEYACRAGTRSAYFWGEEVDEDWCWFGQGDAWCAHPPHEHDQRANAFGLVDMAGNVFEWCEDAYGRYWQAPADGQPLLEARTRQRVLRGGDSFNGPDYCRSARRHSSFATDRGGGIGLRVARSCPC